MHVSKMITTDFLHSNISNFLIRQWAGQVWAGPLWMDTWTCLTYRCLNMWDHLKMNPMTWRNSSSLLKPSNRDASNSALLRSDFVPDFITLLAVDYINLFYINNK